MSSRNSSDSRRLARMASDGRTWMRDRVDYAVPGGWLVDALFVRHDLRRIFDYRASRLRECLA